MRKRRYLVFIFVIALAGILVWILYKKPREPKRQLPSAVETQQSPVVTNLPHGSIANPKPRTSEAPAEDRLKQRDIDIETGKNEWRTPIEFYGKVLDENDNPIYGVRIEFSCNDLSLAGTSKYNATSDGNGLFSLKNVAGKLLVVRISKEGYDISKKDYNSFYYAGQNSNFIPDANNPVVFHLRKRGLAEPLVAVDFPGFGKVTKLQRTGEPVELDLMKGGKTSAGKGQIKLEFWGEKIERSTKQFNWKLHISMPQGGLVRTDEEFNFQAPEKGYEPDIEIDMPVSAEGWYSDLTHKYFIQLPSGNYGRIQLMFLARNGVFTIQSFINLSGSRNLEYDEAIQPKQTVFE